MEPKQNPGSPNGGAMKLLCQLSSPRIRQSLDMELVRYTLDLENLQTHEHNCCVFMQQHHRVVKDSNRHAGRPRRCEKVLRRFCAAALPRLAVQSVCGLARRLRAMPKPDKSDDSGCPDND